MEIRTEVYERAYGKAPRGKGHWAFSTKRTPDDEKNDVFWAYGTFSEAKKAAKKHFAGEYTVYVLS